MGRLDDQVAVVTGASDELGRCIAAALAAEGAAVVVHARRDREAADALVTAITAAGGRATAVGGDLARPSEAGEVVGTALQRFGRLDILVNNNAWSDAGGTILALTDADWQDVLEASLGGTFYCMRAALREFVRQRRGRIVNVTSPPGQGGGGGQANYVASRSGVGGLTRAVAREVGSRGITVNAVAPGYLAAGMAGSLPEEMTARYAAQIPLGRVGSCEEVAAAVVFLASNAAAYMTGQVLHVDGGLAMH